MIEKERLLEIADLKFVWLIENMNYTHLQHYEQLLTSYTEHKNHAVH